MSITLLFKTILSLSFMGSILAGIIVLMKGLFKSKLSANWHYYIWLLLAIRLIIPYAPESPLSVFNLLPTISESSQAAQNAGAGFAAVDPTPSNMKTPSGSGSISISDSQNQLDRGESSGILPKRSFRFNYDTIGILWLIGAAAVFMYALLVNVVLIIKIKKQPRCKEEAVLEILENSKALMGIYRDVPVILEENLRTPSLFGLIKPKLLIPQKILMGMSEQEKGFVFLHELAHLKRRDIFINWTAVIVQALHWFNPIVWYAFRKMREDCEVACDAYVLSRIKPGEYKGYGETILSLISSISNSYWIPVTTGMANNKSIIRRRIRMIAVFKKNPWKWSVLAAVMIIGLGIVGLTSSISASNGSSDANILSQTVADFNKDSHNEKLTVTMTSGRYYEDNEPGPFMGPNWEGQYVVRLFDDKGKMISELDLNQAFGQPVLNFQSVFDVEFADYNNDGNADFAIGQYGSSNGNIYKLFTITPEGIIKALPVKGQSEILCSGENRYSVKFEKAGIDTFKNQYYDNSKGEMVEDYYSWSQSENQFVKKPVDLDHEPMPELKDSTGSQTEPPASENAGANAIVYTNTQYGFTFSLPESWEGYSIITDSWGSIVNPAGAETGPLLSIRHPKWTAQKQRQDIPIMIFTIDQWDALQRGDFYIGAAPFGPSELGRNDKYVFAIPARYNYAFPEGFKEVERILEGSPFQAY